VNCSCNGDDGRLIFDYPGEYGRSGYRIFRIICAVNGRLYLGESLSLHIQFTDNRQRYYPRFIDSCYVRSHLAGDFRLLRCDYLQYHRHRKLDHLARHHAMRTSAYSCIDQTIYIKSRLNVTGVLEPA